MKRYTLIILFIASTAHAQGDYAEALIDFSTEKEIENTFIADSTGLYTVKEVQIFGNRRTKNSIVMRELNFKLYQPYELKDLVKRFYETKQLLMNTGLFRNVVVALKSIQDKDVVVDIQVEERWYLYPIPFVKVVDDKFSQWWGDKGRDLNQLIYGIRLTQKNFTGRNDRLMLNLMNGYTKQLTLQYQGLMLDKEMKWSSNFTFSYGKNKEINYITNYNRQWGMKNNNEYLYTFANALAEVVYRPAIKTRHTFSLGYQTNFFADTILKLNSNFSSGEKEHFPVFSYSLSYINLDFIPYPTKGLEGEVALSKNGLNSTVNMWQLSAKGSSSWLLGEKSFFNLKMVGVLKLPFKQPYMMQRFVGSGDYFLQGYENFTVDGVAGGYTKATFAHPIINTSFRLPENKFRVQTNVPFRVYVKAFTNAGYVHNVNEQLHNNLNNKMLYSSGIGIDIIAFTDLVFKLEWSFNQLGQNGLYLHQREKY